MSDTPYPPNDCGQHSAYAGVKPKPPIVLRSQVVEGDVDDYMTPRNPMIAATDRPYGDTPTEWDESEKLRRVPVEQIVEAQAMGADHLIQALRDAEAAHARYIEAGHDGDDWPTFYARHIRHLRPEVDW